MVKNPSATQETWVRSLSWEDPLENGKAAHSCVLAWRIPWTEERVGYSPESDTTNTFTFTLGLGSCCNQDSFQTMGSLTPLSPLQHLLVSWSHLFKKGMWMVWSLCPYISKDCFLLWSYTKHSMAFFFFFCLRPAACRILVPQPGIKPMPPAMEAQSLNHWTTRDVPNMAYFKYLDHRLFTSKFHRYCIFKAL